MKQLFTKHPKLIFTIFVIAVIAVLCIVFKYNAIIPIIILLVLSVSIMITRKILRKKREKDSQEVAQCALTANETDKLAQYFVSKDEKYISSLGNGYIMNYLANGNLSKGFSVISNKRVYFRGSCFSGQGKALVKTNEERTVDIKDITGSGFIYRRYLGVLLGLFTALIILLGGIAGSTIRMAMEWRETAYRQQLADAARVQDIMDDIDNHITNRNEQISQNQASIEENQASIEEIRIQRSELETLKSSEIKTIAIENASDFEFLRDTQVTSAYGEYLNKMYEIYENSELYRLLKQLYDHAQDSPISTEQRYYNGYTYTQNTVIDVKVEPDRNKVNGNMITSYSGDRGIDLAHPLLYAINAVGNSVYMIELAYTPDINSYSGEELEAIYNTLVSEYPDYIELYQKLEARLDPEDIEASHSAYREFKEKIAPNYVDDDETDVLVNIVIDYFVNKNPHAYPALDRSGITTEYDSQISELDSKISELNGQIASLTNSNTELMTEITELQNRKDNRSSYEDQYNKLQQETAVSFTRTSLCAIVTGLLIPFLISCLLIFLDYLRKRKTLFRIEYAGGYIAFNVSYYAKAEIDDFQKQLRRAKDLAEESVSKITVTESPVPTTAQNSVPDDLRKYADLLKEGLISQEEYDTMKKKILGL
ncbi:MAG: SHOCT domain-containing protein [Candidatus Gastranaerophilales bacterium]|nr:SHOCT domain-containing protein [Candidatus Gastranaerophilales bacterium]MCM1525734.1 SHOCT domain-containing protein [Bacteroides sp.]